MTKEEILELVGDFTWLWDHQFFIETPNGNFVWSDPGYPHGDNTIRKSDKTYNQYLAYCGISHGRSKGLHKIKDYCGTEIILVDS